MSQPSTAYSGARPTVAFLGVLLLVATGACSAGPTTPPPPRGSSLERSPAPGGTTSLVFDFEQLTGSDEIVTSVRSTLGDASAVAVTLGGGAVRTVADRAGGTAVAFPTSTEVQTGARAVLRVSGPRAVVSGANFQYGVDVMYPQGSAGDSAGDDGDNLLQRGLFDGRGQLKLQVDHGRPGCRIAGPGGETLVAATQTLVAEQWYRLVCQRAAGAVTLFVAPLSKEQDAQAPTDLTWWSWSLPDRTGKLGSSTLNAPVSIGGKLNKSGSIVTSAPDQFTGVLDNVRVATLPD